MQNNPPINLPKKKFKKPLEKDLSIFYDGRQFTLAPLENHAGLYAASTFTKKCRLKLVNIIEIGKKGYMTE